MKKLLSTLAVLVALLGFSTFANAQTAEPLEKGMFFGSVEACTAAHAAGPESFRYYKPDPENLRTVPELAKGLPSAGCALEDVRENKDWSRAWVILAQDVPAIFGTNGVPILDGRCHNTIHEFVFLPLLRGLPGARGMQGLKGDPGPTGSQGPPGKDGVDGKDFVPPTHGWCGMKTNKACNWTTAGVVTAVVVVVGAKTEWYGLAKKDGDPPGGNTGPTFRPPLQISIIPASHGKGGGLYVGSHISF